MEHALDREQSKLYDALAGILGLGDLAAAQQVLRDARLDREHAAKAAHDALPALRALLERTDDERAELVRSALASKRWELDVVAATVDGTAAGDERSVLRKLHDLAGLPVLDRERLNATITDLRDAHASAEKLRGTDAGRGHELASLLQQALPSTAMRMGDLPGVGTEGVLTYQWRVKAREQASELLAEADAVRAAQSALADTIRRARQLIVAAPPALRDAAGASVDVAPVIDLWDAWARVSVEDDAISLASHLESRGPLLIAGVAELRRAATAERERLERAAPRRGRDSRVAATWSPGTRRRERDQPAEGCGALAQRCARRDSR